MGHAVSSRGPPPQTVRSLRAESSSMEYYRMVLYTLAVEVTRSPVGARTLSGWFIYPGALRYKFQRLHCR